MRKKLLIYLCIFILAFSGCKESVSVNETIRVSVEEVSSEDSDNLLEELIEDIDSVQNETPGHSPKEPECIFDQTTQTDSFLVGIEELRGYDWDSETKTAKIDLGNDWILEIKRGGCDHFEFSASFTTKRHLEIDNHRDIIFDKIIWITSLLEEFDGKEIKKAIEEDKVSISKIDENSCYASFMSEELYELYYFNFNNQKGTIFNIGYYID